MKKNYSLVKSILTGISLLLLQVSGIRAQERRVQGRITTLEDNTAVPGVNVVVKGSARGTVTDADGNYHIIVPAPSSVLQFSSLGFISREITVENKTTIHVQLASSVTSLSGVVVTGYSTQHKKDITGAVAVVNPKDLLSIPAVSFTQQLEGRVAGVAVGTSAEPGAGVSVRIRGLGSFYNNDPLLLIDGVPVSGPFQNNLNPNDIESLQVLKDASAASIYGARANNGVIIITTRQGKVGPPRVSYDAYYGVQSNGSPEIPMIKPSEEADLLFQKYQNVGDSVPTTLYGNGPTPRLPDYIWPAGAMEGDFLMQSAVYSTDVDDPAYGKSKFIITKANKEGTDWQKEVYRTAPVQSHNLTVSGGSDKSLYSLGMNYFDQQGIMLYSYFKRYSLRANSRFTVKNNIRLGENLQLSFSDQVSGTKGGEPISSSFVTFHHTPSILPVYDTEGNWASGKALGLGQNPVAYLTRNKDNTGRNIRLLGNVFAEVMMLKDWVARTSFGGQYETGWIRNYTHRTYESFNPGLPGSDSYTEASNYNSTWTWTNTLAYAHTFGSVHQLKVLVGTEAIRDEGRTLAASRNSYYSDDLLYRTLNSGGEKNQTNRGGAFSSSLYSLFGRAEYAYANKYLLTATLRRDGSSRIGYNNPYGVFPAVSVGWRLSQEPFMERFPFLEDLKLRAGWGQTGNQSIDPANSYSTYGVSPGVASYDINGTSTSAVQGVAVNRFGDPNVKWEAQTSANVGVDASFWRGKLDLTLDLYYRRTKDLLYKQPFPGTAGIGDVPFVNVGDMQNKGVEVSLTYRGRLAGDWRLELGLNLTHYRNKILRVGESDQAYFGGDENRSMKGHPMGSFYGYVLEGIFQSEAEVDSAATQQGISKEYPDPFTGYTRPDGSTTRGMGIGRYRFGDVNGDGKISPDDMTIIGNPHPKLIYGINLRLTYRAFDLTAFLQGNYGNDLYYKDHPAIDYRELLYHSWRPDRRDARLPLLDHRYSYSAEGPSSYYVQDGSYLRGRSVILGYTLPASVVKKVGVEQTRIYLQGLNLFTITSFQGADPAIAQLNPGSSIVGGGVATADWIIGLDPGRYALARTLLLGINVSF